MLGGHKEEPACDTELLYMTKFLKLSHNHIESMYQQFRTQLQKISIQFTTTWHKTKWHFFIATWKRKVRGHPSKCAEYRGFYVLTKYEGMWCSSVGKLRAGYSTVYSRSCFTFKPSSITLRRYYFPSGTPTQQAIFSLITASRFWVSWTLEICYADVTFSWPPVRWSWI